MISVAAHALLLYLVLGLPASQRLVERLIPVQIVERRKPPPARTKHPLPPRPRARDRTRRPPAPAAAAAPAAGAGGSFGVAPDDGGAGTFEVPAGRTLEAPATSGAAAAPASPPPLVLGLSDEGADPAVDRDAAPVGPLRAVFPEVPRLAGATGSAIVIAFVDAAGLALQAWLATASAPAFGKAAVEAVRLTRFLPAVRLGVPVARTVRVPVAFELSGPAPGVAMATASGRASGDLPVDVATP